MTFFGFGLLGFSKKNFVDFFPNENQLGFHMRYHLFLHYGWFLQNLKKDFIRTNMNTAVVMLTVPLVKCNIPLDSGATFHFYQYTCGP